MVINDPFQEHYDGVQPMVGSPDLYNLDSLQILKENCTCLVQRKNMLHFEVRCSWKVTDWFTYVSLASSTISIALAIIQQGYIHVLLKKSTPVLSKICLCFFSMMSQVVGLSWGLYLIYMISLQHSLFFMVLFLLLLLRLAPFQIWGSILAQVNPDFFLVKSSFSWLSGRTKRALSVSTPFWFPSLIRGFRVLAGIISHLFRTMSGQEEEKLFQSILPSFTLRRICHEGANMFGCINFNGWIDEPQMMRIIERVYPKFVRGHFNRTVNGEIFRKEEVFGEYEGKMRIFIGNHNILEPLQGWSQTPLLVDLLVNFLFCQLFIYYLSISWREKLRMNMIVLLQAIPLAIDLAVFHSDIISITSFGFSFSNMLICTIMILSSFIHDQRPWLRNGFIFLTYIIFSLFPILVYLTNYVVDLNYQISLEQVEQHCDKNPFAGMIQSQTLGKYMEDEAKLAKIKTIMPQYYIDQYRALYGMLNSFSIMNFTKAFFEIYGPLMMFLSVVPLITISFHHLKVAFAFNWTRRIAVLFILFIFVTVWSVSVPDNRTLPGISWEGGPDEYTEDVFNDIVASTVKIWQASKPTSVDLTTLTSKKIRWIQDEIIARLPPFIWSYDGLAICKISRGFHFQIFHNFRQQYVTISRFKLTICLRILALTPLLIFFYTFILF